MNGLTAAMLGMIEHDHANARGNAVLHMPPRHRSRHQPGDQVPLQMDRGVGMSAGLVSRQPTSCQSGVVKKHPSFASSFLVFSRSTRGRVAQLPSLSLRSDEHFPGRGTALGAGRHRNTPLRCTFVLDRCSHTDARDDC